MRRNTLRNRSARSAVKTHIKSAQELIAQDVDSSDAAVIRAQKALDTAVSHHVLHRNNAARRLSRLMKKFNQAAIAKG
ncbi:MAG: 30S ribosomal protein S20 [Chloroflexota bacterium]|nr:30S ribosomal protein S20 [Chloroflexota bacterium]